MNTLTLLPRGQELQYHQADFVEIAPGIFEHACPPRLAPKWGLVRWKPAQGGLWAPVIQACSALVGRADWRPDLMGTSWHTVSRLALAGFVEYVQPGPKCRAIVLESFFEHLRRVRQDQEWWTAERIARYNATYAAAAEEEDDDSNAGDLSGPDLFAAVTTLPGEENAPETIRRGSPRPSCPVPALP